MADQPAFDEVAAELYALPTDEFVAARGARSKAARAAGDKKLAADIAALRRPTVTAWIVNLLVRDQPELLDTLLALGADLRAAQRDLRGPALRELAAQRNRLVAGLVRAARRVAADAGYAEVSTDQAYEIEQTLHAALTDEDLAAELATGRLTKPLTPTGFGAGLAPAGDTEAPERPKLKAVPPPKTEPKKKAPAKDDDREERETARRQADRERLAAALDAAQADLDQADAELAEATDAAEAAEQARTDADALVESLGEQLTAARRAAREAGTAVKGAHARRAAAERAHTSLTKSRDDAAARLERL
jgi:hypothetical protein